MEPSNLSKWLLVNDVLRAEGHVLKVCNGKTVSTYRESLCSCTIQIAPIFGEACVTHGPGIRSAKLT